MNACYFLTFPDGKRIYAWTMRHDRPPLHTFINFPSGHVEMEGYLQTLVLATTEYLGKKAENDHVIIDLDPKFTVDMETFLKDQKAVGRFDWHRDDIEPFDGSKAVTF